MYKKQSRSRKYITPQSLQVGDHIQLTTNTISDEFVVTENNGIYVILENSYKQKVFKMSISTGNVIDISPAFPIDVQKKQEVMEAIV